MFSSALSGTLPGRVFLTGLLSDRYSHKYTVYVGVKIGGSFGNVSPWGWRRSYMPYHWYMLSMEHFHSLQCTSRGSRPTEKRTDQIAMGIRFPSRWNVALFFLSLFIFSFSCFQEIDVSVLRVINSVISFSNQRQNVFIFERLKRENIWTPPLMLNTGICFHKS